MAEPDTLIVKEVTKNEIEYKLLKCISANSLNVLIIKAFKAFYYISAFNGKDKYMLRKRKEKRRPYNELRNEKNYAGRIH